MYREPGVSTNKDFALVLIDYRPELFESIRSEPDASLVEPDDRECIEDGVPAGARAGSRSAEPLMGELDSERRAA
jgi:hypothetical protein